MEILAKDAFNEGLRRASGDKAKDMFRIGSQIKFSLVYYGDITNRIQAKASAKDRRSLTAKDSKFGNAACFPAAPLRAAFELTKMTAIFNAASYRDLLKPADDTRFMDEAADFASLVGQLLTFGALNTFVIDAAKADLGEYLTSHQTGSEIRERLQAVLQPALERSDDICLVSHSLGCMVAYDVFWKYSMMSEYESLRSLGKQASLWLTAGCPLGEAGVQRNLLDGRYPSGEKFPRKQFARWENIYSEDDYIAHVERMAPSYKTMTKSGYVRSINDTHIENCWSYHDSATNHRVSNPHDLYGYLMHQSVGKLIAKWAV
jgi:hypothetical protein